MAGKITKADLINATINSSDLSKKDISLLIDIFFAQIKNALIQGNVVELRGFGTFEPKLRKGREKARNPKTGESVSVQDRYTAVFKPGKDLKESLQNLINKIDESK